MTTTSKKVVYISGPMTGLPEFNYPEFNRVEAILHEKGYDVINPAGTGVQVGWVWKNYLIIDLIKLLTGGGEFGAADVVVTLDGWENSKGAKLEVHVAEALEIEIVPVEDFLSRGVNRDAG